MTNPFMIHQTPTPSDRVRVRYAPSPTGFLHIGGLRTALYCELFAKRHGGTFLLRIEDTDRSRYVEGAIEDICRSLETCGVLPDEGVWLDRKGSVVQRGDVGPYVQSERLERYKAYADELVKTGKAFVCFCTAERLEKVREEQRLSGRPMMYDGQCRSLTNEESAKRVEAGEAHVIRLKLPKTGDVTVSDMIRGDVTFDWSTIDDQVIMKSDGFPTYHLAATCDDHDMGISHVIRGEEWLPSTPKHVFIYEAFGWTIPKFAHLPLLLNPDKSKLSKRQGDVSVKDYLDKGYIPEALVNFVALLGWNPTGDREVYTHDELATMFDMGKVNKSGAVFNIEKLDWLNAQYLKSMPVERYLTLTHPFIENATDDGRFADRVLLLVRDRVVKTNDVADLTAQFFKGHLEYSNVSLPWKTQDAQSARERLIACRERIERMDDTKVANVAAVEEDLKALIAEKGWGNGDTLWPLRVALSGQDKSPGPFELIAAYGRKRALERIDDALKVL
ncbi:MAG: glutamate--tRNA ligase [Patescibacteria group bacterium]